MTDHYNLPTNKFEMEYILSAVQYNMFFELIKSAKQSFTPEEITTLIDMILSWEDQKIYILRLTNLTLPLLEKLVINSQNNPDYVNNPLPEAARIMWNTLQNLTYLAKPYKNPRMMAHINEDCFEDDDLPF